MESRQEVNCGKHTSLLSSKCESCENGADIAHIASYTTINQDLPTQGE